MCATSLFLIATDLFIDNLSKGDALGLALVFVMMLVFFVVELTRIENEWLCAQNGMAAPGCYTRPQKGQETP